MSIFGQKRNNTELDNKINIPLDTSGNAIINLGDSNKPNDAVSRRFVFRKIKSVIGNYKLDDIKTIKDLLKTEKSDIDQLTESIKNNEESIITLHGKLQKEMAILSESLGNTDDEIKVTLRTNIVLIGERINEIKNSMIKHNQLKNKLAEAEKKLHNMYQLEIKDEIKTLKDDSTELFNTFSEKFDDFKAQLEQSASQRSRN
jgi:adenylosuccinate synthase